MTDLLNQPVTGIFSEVFLESDILVGCERWQADSESPSSLSLKSIGAAVFLKSFDGTWNESSFEWDDVAWPETWDLLKKANDSAMIPANEKFFLDWAISFDERGGYEVGYNSDFANIKAYGVESAIDVSSLDFSTKPSPDVLLADIDIRFDYDLAGPFVAAESMFGFQRTEHTNDLYGVYIIGSLSDLLYEEQEDFDLSISATITPTRDQKIGNAIYQK